MEGWILPLSLNPLSEGQLEKTWSCAIVSHIINKIDDFMFGFSSQSQLKFGGGINSGSLISYFMSILSNKMYLTKIKGMSIFTNFT